MTPGCQGLPAEEVIDGFLAELGLRGMGEALLLRGGANNRVYRVPAGDGSSRSAVLKIYFRRSGETWDRFATEAAFHRWAVERAPEFVSVAVAWNEPLCAGVFEWVEGESYAGHEPSRDDVGQAAQFACLLQRGRGTGQLAPAAEAKFSGPDHAALLEGRIGRLLSLEPADELDAAARDFVGLELVPRWAAIRGGIEALDHLVPGQRCISPSDFGFHNAIRRSMPPPCFFDFEYAGIDDPAKLVCDFFWQPAVPVDWTHAGGFLEAVDRSLGGTRWLAPRAAALFPAFGLKWCCIMLNDFVRADQARREFALGSAEAAARRSAQLDKARAMLPRLDAALEAAPFA